MLKIKNNIQFDSFFIPAIILVLLSFFGNKGILYFKILFVITLPLLTIIYLSKKIKNIELEKLKKIQILIVIFIFELLFSIGIMFCGMPLLPFFIAPFNNLYLYGASLSTFSYYLFKKNKVQKKQAIYLILGMWGVIFLYQFSSFLLKK